MLPFARQLGKTNITQSSRPIPDTARAAISKAAAKTGLDLPSRMAEPTRRMPTDQVGLAVAYSDIVALLDKMVQKGAVDCQFRAGPMPQISLK